MEGWVRKVTAVVSATVLAVILLSVEFQTGGGGGTAGEPGDELKETLKNYADGTLEQDAEEVASQVGLLPSGDTCLMRHPNLAREASRDLRYALSAVSLAGDATRARAAVDRLIELNSDASPVEQWRLQLEAVRLAIRATDPEAARLGLEAILGSEGIPDVCKSDTLYLLSLVDTLQAFALLNKAAELDPAAIQVHEARLIHVLQQRPQTAQECSSFIAAQIKAIVLLDKLLRSDRELFRLEAIALSAAPGVIPDILLGFLAEQRSDVEAAREAYQRSLTHPRAACASDAAFVVNERLSNLGDML